MPNSINALSVLGQITTTFQGLACILVAIVFLVAGIVLTINKPKDVQSKVLKVDASSQKNKYDIVVQFVHPETGEVSIATLQSDSNPGIGSDMGLSLTSFDNIVLRKPWGTYSTYLISGAILLLGLAYLAINVIATRRNAAAVAGGFAILNIIRSVV